MSEATRSPSPYGPDSDHAAIGDALRDGMIPIAVYGLGKLGLPVAVAFAEVSGAVTGVDVDTTTVDTITAGKAPFSHEPELDAVLEDLVAGGRLNASTDAQVTASEAAIHVVVVPVPLVESRADLTAIENVLEPIGAGLAPGDLVIIESTVPPGTCDELVAPPLHEISGLPAGTFGVASAPERTQSGRALSDIRGAYPRIVGGIDRESTRAAHAVYDTVTDNTVIPVTDARTAEAVKLFEGVYRDVNIALANELARAFESTSLNVLEVIEAANTLPLCDIHTPGAGVGGHCIPYYPYFLMERASRDMPLVQTARAVNDRMPIHLADVTLASLHEAGIPADEATIVILGLSYRPEIPEIAASPAIPLIERLESTGAHVIAVDPVIDDIVDVDRATIETVPDLDADAIVLVTAHDAFATMPWEVLDVPVLIDGRNAIPDRAGPRYTIGTGRMSP